MDGVAGSRDSNTDINATVLKREKEAPAKHEELELGDL
jgi:hypothetical protein